MSPAEKISSPSGLVRRKSRSAFSVVEIIVALGLFVVIASSFAFGVIQIYQLAQWNWIRQSVRYTAQSCMNQVWGLPVGSLRSLAEGQVHRLELKTLQENRTGKKLDMQDQSFALDQNTSLNVVWRANEKKGYEKLPVHFKWIITNDPENHGCFVELTYSYSEKVLKGKQRLYKETLRIFRAY